MLQCVSTIKTQKPENMKKILFLAMFILFYVSAQAQSYKEGHLFGATVNIGSGEFATAFSWSHYHGFGEKKRFKLGYGLRMSNYFGSNQDYRTAPAKYTSGKESFAALFSEDIVANFDTVSFKSVQANALNAGIYLSYTPKILKDKLDIGVNIDAIGFSFGGKQQGFFRGEGVFNEANVGAKATPFNLLLISDSDLGSLNSEWYLRYWLSEQWAIKLGYEFLFTEFTTDDKIQPIPNTNEFNDRFRRKSSMLMLGVQFAPFRKK
jgi:hypothetical protein